MIHGRFAGHASLVESAVHQKSAGQPQESSAARHVISDMGQVVTVGQDRLEQRAADDP